jgi:hemerythrin-like domain-containing protein
MPTRQLRTEHADLVRLSRQLRMLLYRPALEDHAELLLYREQFHKALMNHLITEDWLLYPRLQASPDPEIAEMAARFTHEMGGLRDSVQLWMAIWTRDAISKGWDAFRSETETLLDALSVRIVRENRELYPMLERVAVEV